MTTSALASSAQLGPFAAFRNRSFTLLWTGQLISTIGSALTSLAAGILVYRLTGSALSVGLMLMATALPTLLVGLVAGVFVDRWDRKKIMGWSNLLQAVIVGLIPLLIPFGIGWLYLMVALSSAVSQFFDPALESVLPEVATDAELASANSMMSISAFGSTAVGFAAAGLIASSASIEWAFYIDALTFLVSAALVTRVSVGKIEIDGDTTVRAVIDNLRAGIGFLTGNVLMRALLFVGAVYALSVGLWNVLLLPFALDALNASEFEYGLQEGLTSVGFVGGSLLMATLANRLREGQWIVISLFGMTGVGLLYAFTTSVTVAIGLVIVSGLMNAPYGIARRLLVQRNTPREMRGRVHSAMGLVRDVVLLVGMAAAGLADLIDIRLLVAAASLILLVPAVLSLMLPGLGQPAAEWRRAARLLRGIRAAPGLSASRGATPADIDALVMRLPALSVLGTRDRANLAAQSYVSNAPTGAAIVRRGDASDAAYFVLEGRAVAGQDEQGGFRPLETLAPGDFFGEIAALTGAARTANVVAEEPTSVLQVPAAALRQLMTRPELNRLLMSTMTERMVRMNMVDLPRYSSLDQGAMRELRTPEPATPAEQRPLEPAPA